MTQPAPGARQTTRPTDLSGAALTLRDITDNIAAGATCGGLVGGSFALLLRRPREDFPQAVAGGAWIGGLFGLAIELLGRLQ